MSMGGTWWRMQNSTRLSPLGKTNASETVLVQFQTFLRYKPVSLFRMSHFIGVTVHSGRQRNGCVVQNCNSAHAETKSIANARHENSVVFSITKLLRYNLWKKLRAVEHVAWLNSDSMHFFIWATASEISLT